MLQPNAQRAQYKQNANARNVYNGTGIQVVGAAAKMQASINRTANKCTKAQRNNNNYNHVCVKGKGSNTNA